MKTYARIESGVVVEIIEPAQWPDGTEIPVEERFTPQFVDTLVDVTDVMPQPEVLWSATSNGGAWTFTKP